MVMNINTCPSLSSQVRQAADIKYLTAAQRMANSFNRKKCVKSFGVGVNVSMRIPQIDRTSSDLLRLPCHIVEVLGGACPGCLSCTVSNLEFLYNGMTF